MKLLPLLPLLALTSFGASPSATDAPKPGSLLPGGPASWDLVWSDEFDGDDVALDARWRSQNGPSGHILSSRWRENVEISNGTVRLVNRKESRGGQNWTSGSIWTRARFQYGYFECRYRYAAAEGTNNSFWLMNAFAGEPARGKQFEIDINEGHFPNEINTNIHNWSDITVVNGRKTHPSASKSFAFGVRPDVTVQLEIPVRARKLRLTSKHPSHFHIGEFRAYGVSSAGYPQAVSSTADTDVPGLVNYARAKDTRVTVSGFHKNGPDSSARLVDGNPATTWISQSEGEKSVELEFADERLIGCVQFLNGWNDRGNVKNMLENYRLEYFNGERWIEMAAFDVRGGSFNFARDYHTYGLLWSPTELVFYFNGKELRREANTFCHSPAPVFLSLAIIAWAGPVTDAIDKTQMEVDYVRVYHPATAPVRSEDAPTIVHSSAR